MNIFIASDHKGLEFKDSLVKYLEENNLNVNGISLQNNESDDYPDFAFEVCQNVVKDKEALGILICGNGIGMSIAANKVKGIRAARVYSVDDAFKSRNHNGVNVITLGSNIDLELAKEIVDTFINTKSATEERHIRRINKIIDYENTHEL